jgi:glycosyltransferase involved in cell wall biosynthesis
VRTVPRGVGAPFQPAAAEEIARVRARHGLPARYVLCLGTLEPRKNLATALAAFAAAGLPGITLVHAGPPGWRLDEAIGRDAAVRARSADVRFIGAVDDADLPALYSGAEAFLFPSLYEGFGFPVLEAMACGVPVLCSSTSSLPEVAGEAARLVNPLDVNDIAQGLRDITTNDDLRRVLIERGYQQAQQFSWQACAEVALSVFEKTLEQDKKTEGREEGKTR